MKMKKSARRRHCSKIFKTNLKTHISPLLNRPQGCQGCQKNQKDSRITTMIHFAANFQPNFKKIWKIIKKPPYFYDFCWFWRPLCNLFNFGWKLAAKWIVVLILRSFRFFKHPWHPWGRLSSGDIWFELEKSSKSQCVRSAQVSSEQVSSGQLSSGSAQLSSAQQLDLGLTIWESESW